MKTTLATFTTFAASVVVGCTAAIAIASTAAVSQAAPMLRPATGGTPVEVIRLEPVVVTASKAYYDAVRDEDARLARTDAKKVTRG